MRGKIWAVALALLAAALASAQGTIKSISVVGNKQVSKEAILLRLATLEGAAYSATTVDRGKRSIESMGFFQAVDVRATPVEGSNWSLTVDVKEWPVVKEIRIVGNKSVRTDEILKVLEIAPGKIFNLNSIKPSVEKINELYRKKGYFGPVEEFGPLEGSPETVSIAILEMQVESVGIEGNKRTQPWLFGKLIKTRAGDSFNRERWMRDLGRIAATGWFSEDVRSRHTEPEPGMINLVAEVEEIKTRNLNVGAAIDPRNSVAGFLRVSETNMNGSGQSVSLDLTQPTGGGGTGIGLDYANPFLRRSDTSLQVSLYSRPVRRFVGASFGGSETPTGDQRYTEHRLGGQVALARPINEQTVASVATRVEDVSTGDLKTGSQSGFIQQDGTLATVALSLTRNTRDVEVNPSRGDWFRIEFQPGFSNIRKLGGDLGDSAILGPNAFVKSSIEYRRYLTDQGPREEGTDEPRRVLALRVRYGVIAGNVPFFEQFFAGGVDTIRGYSEDRFWGKQQFLTSLEYRHPVMRTMNLIGFVDYGGAWGGYGSVNSFRQSRNPNFSLGYGLGIGVRIRGIGPLRLDYGFDKSGRGRAQLLIGTSV
jgi:outer membrane protein insertion porin family